MPADLSCETNIDSTPHNIAKIYSEFYADPTPLDNIRFHSLCHFNREVAARGLQVQLINLTLMIRGAFKNTFKSWEFGPTRGRGVTESQVLKMDQTGGKLVKIRGEGYVNLKSQVFFLQN